MVSEAAVREAVAPDDHAAAESPTPEVMVTVVADPSKEVVRASTAEVTALVLSSSHRSFSPPIALGISGQRLDDDVMWDIFKSMCLSLLERVRSNLPNLHNLR
jgi:hypothetical protein